MWLSLEHLHSKQEALSSKPQDHQKKRGGRDMKGRRGTIWEKKGDQ
jgi:hypothetical protein